MIVPDFWAEARRQHKSPGKQITVRRFGWSNVSEADALAIAEERAETALGRILSGENLQKREPKVPYNGAAGIPIREEVLERHGEQVITRNSYGAHCLNSPDALFADIDFIPARAAGPALLTFAILAIASGSTALFFRSWSVALALLFVSMIACAPLARLVVSVAVAARGGPERIARKRLGKFLAAHREWSVRIYRTPAGLRLLVTHRPFEANAREVQQFFAAVAADPVYIRMCLNQQCFRARLTAKPWRIGIAAHMRPRPGIWPVSPERVGVRNEWVAAYETRASNFAACRYLESWGSGSIHPAIQGVVDLHDSESRALVADAKLA
jgi:hypothetical protein